MESVKQKPKDTMIFDFNGSVCWKKHFNQEYYRNFAFSLILLCLYSVNYRKTFCNQGKKMGFRLHSKSLHHNDWFTFRIQLLCTNSFIFLSKKEGFPTFSFREIHKRETKAVLALMFCHNIPRQCLLSADNSQPITLVGAPGGLRQIHHN